MTDLPRPEDRSRAARHSSPRARARTPIAVALAILIAAGAAAAGYLVGHARGVDAQRAKSAVPTPSTVLGTLRPPKTLSHAAAEAFIAHQYSLKRVICFDGYDMPSVVGTVYRCIGETRSFTLTITSPDGNYQIVPTG